MLVYGKCECFRHADAVSLCPVRKLCGGLWETL